MANVRREARDDGDIINCYSLTGSYPEIAVLAISSYASLHQALVPVQNTSILDKN